MIIGNYVINMRYLAIFWVLPLILCLTPLVLVGIPWLALSIYHTGKSHARETKDVNHGRA